MSPLKKEAFELIHRKIGASRADIARLLNVSRPTASSIVQQLLTDGLIVECGKGVSTGGTAPVALAPRRDAFFSIGIDIGYDDCMSAVLLDNAGEIADKFEIDFQPGDMEDIAEKIGKVTEHFAACRKVSALALAIPGIVDEERKIVVKSIAPAYEKRNIYTMLEQNSKVPFLVGNRSRLAALGEAFGGAADMESDFAVISLGRSIGAAFWCGNKLFYGSNFAAGEIRNMHLSNGMTIENALAQAEISKLSIGMIAELCAQCLIVLADIMDMELFVLCGRFAAFGDDFAHELEKIMSKHHPVRVRLARYGRFSAARGGAFLAGENFIKREN